MDKFIIILLVSCTATALHYLPPGSVHEEDKSNNSSENVAREMIREIPSETHDRVRRGASIKCLTQMQMTAENEQFIAEALWNDETELKQSQSVARLQNGLAQACGSFVLCEMPELCRELMTRIDSSEFDSKVVKALYNIYNTRIPVLIKFISLIEDVKKKGGAYQLLYNQMSQGAYSKHPLKVEVAYRIHTTLKTADVEWIISEPQSKFVNFILANFDVDMSAWGQKIRNGSMDEVVQFSKTYTGIFSGLLDQLVRTTYNKDIKNIHNIMKLKSNLPWVSHYGILFKAVYDEIVANNQLDNKEIFILGYHLKSNFKDSKEGGEVSHYFEPLKNRLPAGVRRVFFDDWISFKSLEHSGYSLYMSQYGNVYVYPENNYEGGKNQMWTVEAKDDGKYFSFKCKENEQVLYADLEGHAYGKERDGNDARQNWEIIPINDAKSFYIKNGSNGKILDAASLKSCFSSKTSRCSTARAYHRYTGATDEKWNIV